MDLILNKRDPILFTGHGFSQKRNCSWPFADRGQE